MPGGSSQNNFMKSTEVERSILMGRLQKPLVRRRPPCYDRRVKGGGHMQRINRRLAAALVVLLMAVMGLTMAVGSLGEAQAWYAKRTEELASENAALTERIQELERTR